jgi:hypothetical protein
MPPDPDLIKMTILQPAKSTNFRASEIGCDRIVIEWTSSAFGYYER